MKVTGVPDGAMPVTRPLVAPIVATDGALLVQPPPEVRSDKSRVAPAHIDVAPPAAVMAAGALFVIVTGSVLVQLPPPEVFSV